MQNILSVVLSTEKPYVCFEQGLEEGSEEGTHLLIVQGSNKIVYITPDGKVHIHELTLCLDGGERGKSIPHGIDALTIKGKLHLSIKNEENGPTPIIRIIPNEATVDRGFKSGEQVKLFFPARNPEALVLVASMAKENGQIGVGVIRFLVGIHKDESPN